MPDASMNDLPADDLSKTALLIIDFQEDFVPGQYGSLAVTGGRDIAPTINKLLSMPFALKVATRDFHPNDHISFASQHEGAQAFTSQYTIKNPDNADETQTTALWPDHCVQGTPGCELVPELNKDKLDVIVDKGQDRRVESYSAFGPPFRKPQVAMSGLDEMLWQAGVNTVFVVGVAFDYCVKHTAIDAAANGFDTFVIESATKAVDQSEAGLAAARGDMEAAGVSVVAS